MCAIARYTLLEAVRSRLFVLLAVSLVGLFGLAEFIGELAITESRQIQATITASLLRIFSVAVICLFAITSILREWNDKSLQVILSLPLPRHGYLFGKLTGFAVLALSMSLLCSLPLFLYAPARYVFCWLGSLFCEQLLMVSLSFVCVLTLPAVTLCFVTVMAFYLLARSMQAIRLLSDTPILAADTMAQNFMRSLADALALILPDLHEFTRSDWLVHGIEAGQAQTVLMQTGLYLALLLSAGLFDLYRRNF